MPHPGSEDLRKPLSLNWSDLLITDPRTGAGELWRRARAYLALVVRRARARDELAGDDMSPVEEHDIDRLAAALASANATRDGLPGWPELDPANFLLDPNRLYTRAELIDLIVERIVRSRSPFVLHRAEDPDWIAEGEVD